MKNIRIIYSYNKSGTSKAVFSISITQKWGGRDTVIITDQTITIDGQRKKGKPEEILINTKNTLYLLLIRSIFYVFFTRGKQFDQGALSVEVNGEKKEYPTSEIVNPCPNDLEKNLRIKNTECQFLFKVDQDKILSGYSWFLKAIQSNEFDYYWKAFNAIYSRISNATSEQNKLADMRIYLERNWVSFKRSNAYFNEITDKEIRGLRIREFILSEFATQKKTREYAEMVKSFSDVRLAKVLFEVMPYRKDFLIREGLYSEVVNHLNNMITQNEKKNSDLARFYILKYTYYLRNKYIHAEKASPEILVRNNNEITERMRIMDIMKLFLADLFETVSKFV